MMYRGLKELSTPVLCAVVSPCYSEKLVLCYLVARSDWSECADGLADRIRPCCTSW